MPPIIKSNRNYKKGKPFRDARKFILICEGEREANYFKFFDGLSQKLIIETIAPNGVGQSSPNHLKERASEYILQNGWSNDFHDQLWFILDVDRWNRESIKDLFQLTEITTNWFIAISNQCFEVWLYYHKSGEKILANSSKHMKQILNQQTNGGYKVEVYAPDISKAIKNSEALDQNKNSYFPDKGVTKLYLLAIEIAGLFKFEDGEFKII